MPGQKRKLNSGFIYNIMITWTTWNQDRRAGNSLFSCIKKRRKISQQFNHWGQKSLKKISIILLPVSFFFSLGPWSSLETTPTLPSPVISLVSAHIYIYIYENQGPRLPELALFYCAHTSLCISRHHWAFPYFFVDGANPRPWKAARAWCSWPLLPVLWKGFFWTDWLSWVHSWDKTGCLCSGKVSELITRAKRWTGCRRVAQQTGWGSGSPQGGCSDLKLASCGVCCMWACLLTEHSKNHGFKRREKEEEEKTSFEARI